MVVTKGNRTTLIALLLQLIFLGPQLLHVLHQVAIHHQHEVVECTLENELNLCHLKLFHNNDIDGCDHKSHIIKEGAQCHLCAVLSKVNHQKYQLPPVLVSHKETISYFPYYHCLLTPGFDYIITGRGPPLG